MNKDKRKRGRPPGTGRPIEPRRVTCRYCGVKLGGSDPTRRAKYGNKIFMGDCLRCYADRIVIKNWIRRGKVQTLKNLNYLKHQRELMEYALECIERIGGGNHEKET